MRILFTGMQWDYGDPARGPSHEYTNLFDSLRSMPELEVAHVDAMAAHLAGGPTEVRRQLLDAVESFRPDLVFSILMEDEIPPDVLRELQDRDDLVSFNWFADDHWRFETFTRRLAPYFDACSTTATSALPKYARLGYDRVVKTQWAANPNLYHPVDGRPRPTVTFVGQAHGTRPETVAALRASGLPVETRGLGWREGRIDHDEMVRWFSTSSVNLNLSNSSTSRDLRSRLRRRLGLRTQLGEQIKGRNFEIPACGGFQLSGHADDIESYFEPDVEIVLFSSVDELIRQAERYLTDEDGRRRIAQAGYERTLREHTYAHRFRAIFRALELPGWT